MERRPRRLSRSRSPLRGIVGSDTFAAGVDGAHGELGAAAAFTACRDVLLCANPRCWFVVHSNPRFGGYCCMKCHGRHDNKSRRKERHDGACEQKQAAVGAQCAQPVPPGKVNGAASSSLGLGDLEAGSRLNEQDKPRKRKRPDAKPSGHPACISQEDCTGHPGDELYQHILEGKRLDLYCGSCWRNYKERFGDRLVGRQLHVPWTWA
eukprot:TRINITY_DN16876_c0_g1_i3.p1 TRINITY_DN16876_c0_g1~~TRINITY_DN16876_c0_g1_i3.p1  ORF type:complete len:240 (+),score=21.95 TRINITY_DN16876_c0_g1_i3:98-721(+)